MGDNSHGGTLTVQERPGSRHVPDVLFQAPNGMRYRFDRYSQKALQFATVVDQYVTANAVQELAEYQAKTSNATPIPAVPPHKLIREAGRRRWILTSWDDGHGRPDPTDATLPGPGCTVVEYFADSDMIRRVYRKGGKVGLYFAYDPVDLDSTVSPRFKAAAVAENFGFLKSGEARFQDAKGEPRNPADPLDFVVRLTFAPDTRRYLARVERIASEDRTTVDQTWEYAYVQACSKAFVVLGWAAYELPRRTGCEALYEDAEGLHVSSRFASMISGRSDVRASRYDSVAPKKMRK